MKSFIEPIVFGILAVGVSAQYTSNPPPVYSASTTLATSASPSSTSPTEAGATCPAIANAACRFTCTYVGQRDPICQTDFLAGGTSRCTVCEGPKACPAVADTSCAFLCTSDDVVTGAQFCSSKDESLIFPGHAKCTPCGGSTGGSSTSAAAPSSTSPAAAGATCPTTYDATCPFTCRDVSHFEPICSTQWSAGGSNRCTVCPGIPSVCPATADKSCAFVCKTGPTLDAATFCASEDLGPIYPSFATCTACGGSSGGNSTTTAPVPPPTYVAGNGTTVTPTNPTNPPKPTYSSGASAVSMGSAAVIGLICFIFAF
ncbi:hypothetical protein ABW20_dc0107732 [Dactylellina cionopaga]|nr:hypothetical protein ABW20_dc0107732 [Dactylellina cionopaga]